LIDSAQTHLRSDSANGKVNRQMTVPALVIAGTHSGSGKTTVALAILAALVRRGLRVQAFKVGPDFIDPGHHAAVTGRPSRNLDTWLLDPRALARTYRRATEGAEVAIIEGVMGLFDGRGPNDEAGSTADLARLWDVPVVLVVDARGLVRSIAPLVRGFAEFDARVKIVGAIANQVGSRRHADAYLEPALRAATAVESLGFLMRDPGLAIPSRHLGLWTASDFRADTSFLNALAKTAESSLPLDRILALASPPRIAEFEEALHAAVMGERVRVGVARDSAFCFYYEDNLDLLRDAGAELVTFSPLEDRSLPEGIERLYLGGGYPELAAARLAANTSMCHAIRRYHADGGIILAECGGMMACCRELRDVSGQSFPMWDLIPARVAMQSRLAALGYVTLETDEATCLGPAGTRIRGHEFHYSTLEPLTQLPFVSRLVRSGAPDKPDGIQIGGLLAGYAHLHFGSNAAVASRFVER
jgi:cobyrinic acid a,c-diamide synthase